MTKDTSKKVEYKIKATALEAFNLMKKRFSLQK